MTPPQPNRKQGPKIHEIREIQLPPIGIEYLSGGSPLYFIQTVDAPIVRLEITIDAGRLKEPHPLVSRASSAMLKEGTKRFDREEMTLLTDESGSVINISSGLEFASIQLYCLENKLDLMLEIIGEMLMKPSYLEERLRKYIRRKKNQLKEDLSINEILAYRKLTELLFGSDHPYGYNSSPEMYDSIKTTDLRKFHSTHYRKGNMKLFICCKDTNLVIGKISQLWKQLPEGSTADKIFFNQENEMERVDLKATQSVQASIRMGKTLFPRSHPDFPGMYFVNTLFGGFFGSHLVNEVREKLGLTYNIFSTVETFRTSGLFLAGCETDIYSTEKVIELIFLEMEKMRSGQIDPSEMTLVRNYLFGHFISTLDGPINTMELMKVFITEGAGLDSFYNMMSEFAKMDMDRVIELSQKYLNEHQMKIVVVR